MNSLIPAIAAVGLLFGSAATAQYRPYPYQTQYEHDVQEQGRVFDRVQNDLYRALTESLPFSDEHSRVITARNAVNRCQRSLAAGDYESRYCDDAIAATQQVADLNRVSDRTRDYLLDDTHDLRRLQDRLDER